MNNMLSTKLNINNRKAFAVLLCCLLIVVMLTMAQDSLQASLKNTGFYFSESFMFSSFWWLFAPLLFLQYFAVQQPKAKQLHFQCIIMLLPVIVHGVAFPFLVWILSALFYYHSFAFKQTLTYALSEHVYQLVIMYTLPVLGYNFLARQVKPQPIIFPQEEKIATTTFMETIAVAEGNKRLAIPVSTILYLTASTPYISIHLPGKKYLHHQTLKALSLTLNPQQFVRVHKSTLININMVASYTTRLNGDYDLTMKNDIVLRVSRNYAVNFKDIFNQTHRLTTK